MRSWVRGFLVLFIGLILVMYTIRPLGYNISNQYLLKEIINSPQPITNISIGEIFPGSTESLQNKPSSDAYLRGLALFLNGKKQEASSIWHSSPNVDYWLTLMGRAHLSSREFDKAIEVLEMAHELAQNSSTILYYGGLALQKTGNTDHALEWYRSAVSNNQFDDRFIDPSNDLLWASWWPGDPLNSNLSPTLSRAFLQISSIYYQRGDFSTAYQNALQALRLDPEDVFGLGHAHLGAAYYQLAEIGNADPSSGYDQAVKHFLQAASRRDQPSIHFYLGLIRWRKGEIKEAEREFLNVLIISNENWVQYQIAGFFTAINKHTLALPLYDSMIANTPALPSYSHYWLHAAEGYWLAEQHDRACSLLNQYQQLGGNRPDTIQGIDLWEGCGLP